MIRSLVSPILHLLPALVLAAELPPLGDGSRVVFLGDSVTQQGANKDHGYIQQFIRGLEAAWPERDIKVIGAGVSGNKIDDLHRRLQRDVIDREPTHVVVYIGINDVWHWKPNRKGTTPERFDEGLRELIAKLRDAGAAVLLCTPSAIGERTDGGNPYDERLDKYADIARTVAADTGTPLLDLRRIFIDELKRINPEQRDRRVLTADGVHLWPLGNRLVADAMLDAFGVPRGQWREMFNGRNLDGWRNPYHWGEARFVDGECHLVADRKFFLATERPYTNFIFEVEIKMPEGKANSGVMFRCHVETNRVYGYQAEVDPSPRQWSGGLYDEGRRKWLRPAQGDKGSAAAFRKQAGDCFRAGEWNRYRIWCDGDRLRIYVNNVKTVDLQDDVDAAGHIALQHHGENGQLYRFRAPRVRELP